MTSLNACIADTTRSGAAPLANRTLSTAPGEASIGSLGAWAAAAATLRCSSGSGGSSGSSTPAASAAEARSGGSA